MLTRYNRRKHNAMRERGKHMAAARWKAERERQTAEISESRKTMKSETPKTDKAPKHRGGVRYERVSAAHARRLEVEMNGYKKTLEYIAFAGLSARHMEHEARKALGIFNSEDNSEVT